MSHLSGDDGRYRAFIHEDGEYLSIGFESTNDTLLKMPDGWRDRERVVAWVAAVNRAQEAVDLLREALELIEALSEYGHVGGDLGAQVMEFEARATQHVRSHDNPETTV